MRCRRPNPRPAAPDGGLPAQGERPLTGADRRSLLASGRHDNNLWNGEGQLLNIAGYGQRSRSYDLRLSNRPLTEISLQIRIYNGGVTNGGPNLNNTCVITH